MRQSQGDSTSAQSAAPPPQGPDISARLRVAARIFAFASIPLGMFGIFWSGEQSPFLHPLTRLGFFCLFVAGSVSLVRALLFWMRPGRVRQYAAQQAKTAAHPVWLAFATLWYSAILAGFALLVAMAPTWVFRSSPASPGANAISTLAILLIVGLVAAAPLLALRWFDRPA